MAMSGFTFGGVHSSAFDLLVNKKTVPLTPEINNRLQEIAGFDGAWDFGSTFGTREIEIECTIMQSSTASLKTIVRNLAGFFNPQYGSRELIFDDDPEVMYYAKLSNQIPLEQIGMLGTFTLQFTCANPFTYGVEVKRGSVLNNLAATIGTLNVDNNDDGVGDQFVNAGAGAYEVDGSGQTIKAVASDTSQYRYIGLNTVPVEPNKRYVFVADVKYDANATSSRVVISNNKGTKFAKSFDRSPVIYGKAQFEGDSASERFYVYNFDKAGTVSSMKFSNLRVYEVDAATYDKIDSDPRFSGTAVGEKFPYVQSTTMYMENEGSHIAQPIVTVTHGGGSGEIENTLPDGSKEVMTFSADSPSGEYVIDCREMTITVDGAAAYEYVEGGFFTLPSGQTSSVFHGGIQDVQFEYRDTWL